LPFTKAAMESVLLAASIYAAAATFAPGNAPVEPPAPASAALDQSCFRLMADLSEDRDPRVQGLGRMAAQYFLGRLDAAVPGFDPDAALAGEAPQGAERSRLLVRCGDAMQAGGRDFRSIGEALVPRGRPTV
jgi:hypothetical protein